VYLYTHRGSLEIETTIQNALAKRWRWDDPEYLARIIFDMMTTGMRDRETGFGISTAMHEDLDALCVVDVPKQQVWFARGDVISDGTVTTSSYEPTRVYTFQEIVDGVHVGKEFPGPESE
jgi:hypothetical protein